MKEEREKEVAYVRQEIKWHLASSLLEIGHQYCALFSDEKFNELYRALEEYVYSKIDLEGNGDLLDLFVVVAQEKEDTEKKPPENR